VLYSSSVPVPALTEEYNSERAFGFHLKVLLPLFITYYVSLMWCNYVATKAWTYGVIRAVDRAGVLKGWTPFVIAIFAFQCVLLCFVTFVLPRVMLMSMTPENLNLINPNVNTNATWTMRNSETFDGVA